MKSGLTPKQEKFAQEVASGKSQADAYRAGFKAGNMKPKTIQEAASRLMADSKVSARVAELRTPIVEKAGITLESHLRDLQALRNMATKAEQFSAAITAEIARGKAAGVVAPEKREHTGKDGNAIAVTNVSPAEYQRIAAKIASET